MVQSKSYCHALYGHYTVAQITSAAVKEEAIESKLMLLEATWGMQDLVFQEYKTRGTVILKVCCLHTPQHWPRG